MSNLNNLIEEWESSEEFYSIEEPDYDMLKIIEKMKRENVDLEEEWQQKD